MATIVTRSGKGSPLTNNEVDANFTNLNTDKLESGDTAASLTITSADINGGTIDGVTIGGSSAGAGSFTTLNTSGAVVFNEAGADVDFRVEGDTDANLLFVDAGNDRVGIGSTNPLEKLFVSGNIFAFGAGSGSGTYGANIQLGKINGPKISSTQESADDDVQGLAFFTKSSSLAGDASVERLRIDSSGNVGIGTSSPGNLLHVSGSGNVADFQTSSSGGVIFSRTNAVGNNSGHFGLSFINADSTVANIQTINRTGGTTSTGTGYELRTSAVGTGYLSYYTNGSEAMRIDASGNLLVGKTAASNTGEGITAFNNGSISSVITTAGGASQNVFLNRQDADGKFILFRKADSTVGSIGTNSTGLIGFRNAGAVGKGIGCGTTAIFPTNNAGEVSDNTTDNGAATARWDDIYATNATIQTSDANEKQDIEELSEAERRVAVAAKGLLRKFRWINSVEEKGDDARIHFGIIAQDLQAAFEAEGLDAGRYAMFIHSTWTDEETGEERSRMGVRYSELLAFIIAAL